MGKSKTTKGKITKEMFSPETTPIETLEEAEKIASRRPVLISVKREASPYGKFIVSLKTLTSIYTKSGQRVEKITNLLIDYYETRKTFDTLEEADEWVSKEVKRIKKARKEIIDRQDQVKGREEEYIIIE